VTLYPYLNASLQILIVGATGAPPKGAVVFTEGDGERWSPDQPRQSMRERLIVCYRAC
jgi:hypothetical protein